MSLEVPLRAAAAPVRRLDELPEAERRLVACARLWAGGAARHADLRRLLEDRGGEAAGRAAFGRLDELMRLLLVHGRRPLRLSPVGAEGVLGDECVLARLVGLAAEGAREEAILMSAVMIRADLALELARVAAATGRVLARAPGAVGPAPAAP
jgi:hypothetical protein